MDGRPFGHDFDVSFLELLEFGVDSEAGLDGKVQAGLVLEVDGDAVIVGCGVKMDALGGLALDLREVDKAHVGQFAFQETEAARAKGATRLGPSLGRFASLRMTS